MMSRISFFCGIFVLFIYSESFGKTDSELVFSQQGIPGDTCKSSATIRLPANPGVEFSDNKPKNISGYDSLMLFIGSGDCSQGYILNADAEVCTGSTMELNSRTALTYQWSPALRFNNPAIQNPFILIDSTRKYYLETTNYTNNLITNPDFELGNTGFYTNYTYCNSPNCLWTLGDNGYSIGTDANYYLPAYFSGIDHTSGSGNFMIVNGAKPSLTVWQQTIPVKQYTKYAFGVWISTMMSLRTAQIQFSINGNQVGDLYNAPVYANKWEQVFTPWNSGSATSATIKIVDILQISEGNDFGLDDLFFGEMVTCSDSITLTASRNVNLGNDTIITPPDQHIELSPSVGFFEQYEWNTGETTRSISITEPGRYWLSASDQNGCTSVDTIKVMNSLAFVVFPNAFKPDAYGVNDVFRPATSNVSKFNMSVYNRWGQLLFETNDFITGWNGIFKGEKCPADLYFYIADYEFQDDPKTKTSRGSFTLIR